MPFVAVNDKNERICILDHKRPRETLGDLALACPLCGEPVGIVAGLIKTPHFRHATNCKTTLEHHGPSYEHELGKEIAALNLKHSLGFGDGWLLDFEVPMPKIGRVADLTITDRQGFVTVGEVQLSSITVESLSKRTAGYRSVGADVWWFLGKAAATGTNIQWCSDNLRAAITLEFYSEDESYVYGDLRKAPTYAGQGVHQPVQNHIPRHG